MFVKALFLTTAILGLSLAGLSAQGPRPEELGASPQAIGDAGIVWYTTWETALAEANLTALCLPETIGGGGCSFFELALVLPPLMWLRRRQRRTAP